MTKGSVQRWWNDQRKTEVLRQKPVALPNFPRNGPRSDIVSLMRGRRRTTPGITWTVLCLNLICIQWGMLERT